MLTTELDTIKMEMLKLSNRLSPEEISNIKEKINSIQSAKLELECECMKKSVYLIGKFVEYNNDYLSTINADINEKTLENLKIFLSICSILYNHILDEISKEQNNKKIGFYKLFLIFIIKCQNKIVDNLNIINKKYHNKFEPKIIILNNEKIYN